MKIESFILSLVTKVSIVIDLVKQLRQIYDYASWRSHIVNQSAASVEDYFEHFDYVLEVDPRKILDIRTNYPKVAFAEYEYPNRTRTDAALIRIFRVTPKSKVDGKHYFDEIWGKDTVFVATNNEQDAVMIALRFT